MQIDEALRYLGNFGRYQTIVFIFVGIVGTWFPAWQMMAMVFTTDQPPGYHCKTNHSTDYGASFFGNDSKESKLQNWFINETSQVEECFINQTVNVNETSEVACSEWVYHMKYGEKTIVTDLGLVCSSAVLPETAQSIFMAGVLVGSLVAGTLSDILGRKTVLMAACLLEGIFGVCIVFTWTYVSFVTIWFFVGLFEQGINIVQFILLIEMFSPEKRTLAGSLNGVSWGIGVILLTPIAYIFRDWRHMQIAISTPNLIAIPLLWWVAFESVRWQISKDRIQFAEKTLHRIAKLNNIEAPDVFLTEDDSSSPLFGLSMQPCPPDVNKNNDHDAEARDKLETHVKVVTEEPFRKVNFLKAPYTVRNAFIMCFSWFASSMVYYGMSLNSSNLAGGKYLNFFLLGLVEIPGYIVIYFLVEWWGRRPSLSLSHFIAGMSSIISACIPPVTAGGMDLNAAIVTFALIGKFGVTVSFGIDFIYGAEIFPTAIRNAGFGMCSFWARIGGIIAPFVVYLADVSPYIPLNVFGVVSLIAAALVVFLPETRKRALPETLAESEMMARSARLPRCPSCLRFRTKRNAKEHNYLPAETAQ